MTLIIKNRLSLLLAASLLLMPLSGCGKSSSQHETQTTQLTEEVKVYGIPSDGVGRLAAEPAEPKGITICVDPGHGFIDGGATTTYAGKEILERDINLAVAFNLRDDLEELGYTVVMTHDNVTLPVTSEYDNNEKYRPQERVAFVNEYDGTIDYFISIHSDTVDDGGYASGTRIYYYEGESKTEHTSGTIAEYINRGIVSVMGADNSALTVQLAAADAYYVLYNTTMPASLVELGFLSNTSDVEKLINSEWQAEIAEAIATGIDYYYSELDGTESESGT